MSGSAPRKHEVAANFSRAALRYESLARHQAIAARNLVARLPADLRPRHVLDLGCGTGLLIRLLAGRFPEADFTAVDLSEAMLDVCRSRSLRPSDQAVRADAEHWWPERPVDLCASSCSVQWFQDPQGWIRAARERLAPQGCLALAFPVEGTLREFMACAPAGTPRLTMPPPEFWQQRFRSAPWRSLETATETLTLFHPSAMDVLRALHGIGATCAAPGAAALRPSVLRRLAADYEARFRASGGVPCTYELLYVIART